MKRIAPLVAALLVWVAPPASAQDELSPLADMVLDSDALLYNSGATYGRAVNGLSFQTETIMTVGDYQYATWYHNGYDQDIYLGRRLLTGSTWQIMDTGEDMDNTTSDAHNVISMGISGDGAIHLSYDHHNNTLRYMNTGSGAADGAAWNSGIFNSERHSLNAGGSTVYDVTYPRFITDPTTGNMHFVFRTGYSGNGDMQMATYNDGTGLWNAHHEWNDGTSANVNPYLNGFDVDSSGRIHTTWTYRPSAGSSNYDIMYAYSDDGGSTWRNNNGASLGTRIEPSDSDLIIDDGNPGNGLLGEVGLDSSLMNQQAQAVDLDGRVHVVMWHADDDNFGSTSGFQPSKSDYFHYFRDPSTGNWTRTALPNDREVGSRPDIAYDADGNVYVAYVTPGAGDATGYYSDGDLVIATASRATGYSDWADVYTDTRDFIGEPNIDQARLLNDGVLSIFVQENDDAVSSLTGTPLHILEYNKLINKIAWAGDDTANWTTSSGTDWDVDGDDSGDEAFTSGTRAVFDDGATSFSVNLPRSVSPAAVDFLNSANAYTLTGAGITGAGGLRVAGGGTVTLANNTNTYTGPTTIESGTLALTGAATIAASPSITVAEGATLDVSGTTGTFTLASGQTLTNNSSTTVAGDLVADGGTIFSSGTFDGSVTLQSGSTLRVGGDGIVGYQTHVLIDDFESYDNSGGTTIGATPNNLTGDVWIGEWDGTGGAHVTDDPDGDQSLGVTEGSGWRGAETDLANNFATDVSLPDGQTATYFYQIMAEGTDVDCMTGLAESRASVDINYPWQDYSVMPYVAGGYLKLYGDNVGDQYIAAISAGEWYNIWVVVDNDSKTYDMYLSTGTDDGTIVASGITFGRITAPVNLEAFAAMNSGHDMVHVDNLYRLEGVDTTNPISTAGYLAFTGEATVTIDGDLTLNAGSQLLLDLGDTTVYDSLDITGTLFAGGTLDVTLSDDAPALALGDSFDLFDFTSAGGAFDAFDLPALATGLAWDTSNLLVTGELQVVVASDPDFDGDGDVDLADLLAWQRGFGSGSTHAEGDANSDGTVDAADLAIWRSHFGGAAQFDGLSIPEPQSVLLLLAGVGCLTFRRKSQILPPCRQ